MMRLYMITDPTNEIYPYHCPMWVVIAAPNIREARKEGWGWLDSGEEWTEMRSKWLRDDWDIEHYTPYIDEEKWTNGVTHVVTGAMVGNYKKV